MAVRVLAVLKVALCFWEAQLHSTNKQGTCSICCRRSERCLCTPIPNVHQFGVSRDDDSDRRNLRMMMMFRF